MQNETGMQPNSIRSYARGRPLIVGWRRHYSSASRRARQSVLRVDVLPFHQLGRYSWNELGMPYTLERTESPTDEAVAQDCELFRAEALTAY